MHRMFLGAAIAPLLILANPAQARPGPDGWTPAWTASMWQANQPAQRVSVENATLRMQVRVGAAGSKIRIRLANDYGPAMRIGAATVRIAGGKPVRVTFDGQAEGKLRNAAPLVSDAVALPVKQFDLIEVSLYMPDKVDIDTVHGANGAKTKISPNGDFTEKDFTALLQSGPRPLLAQIDVLAPKPRPVIVAYGDSITDNVGCANEAVPVCRWGDVLGRRLAAAGMPHVVVTQAIGGNRILSSGSGPNALARFDRDVLALPGVTHVVMLEGINDIGGSGRNNGPVVTVEDLKSGYRQIVQRAHAHGIKVIGLTILPFEGAGYQTPAGEAMRTEINNWILTSGTFDAVVDLQKSVADPANPKRLASALQGGDNLHPNGAGETKMGEAIPLSLFK
ncbi:SGNH/GDSL hydrolase family protein [Sphingomonas sp. HITSZ_GF]|uniref:SGNH/GDSL hydrolase family protein n=1 Tax=Sphingomonas sp. HITSZ_GF TaxID=3037247 RepID=UPI00240E7D06|nr:SGNH/GDSL hydrolase family protein [Sphingomonas sp. HITSZ_GF]MDG2533066.1 SGNH/GDSL hydrolase family protein [Sphingomonas sp. HITSZ_GF]